ncbi:MAG: coenzyme F420-0:L-glutamate ligase [Candidatus Thorarchaeota archaeon]|nr:coenzyme F420-0:L-glutamate ligase [Candidatus Thorarchaeota archaeon]
MRLFALQNIPRVDNVCNLGDVIVQSLQKSGINLEDGDILVVAHTVVSKAEGRVAHCDAVEPSLRALEIARRNGFDPVHVELALRECRRVLRDHGVLITEAKNGMVCNFSGVDRSNAPDRSFVLLPIDADKSADRIRECVEVSVGVRVAVIISDTQGRPWRKGGVNLAIGCSGIAAFRYNRGRTDLHGRILERSTVCHVDEIAAAAEPLMGQAGEGTPVVVVRGYSYEQGGERGKDIPRTREEDLFR